MVPDKFNMVDMGGIDLIMMQGEEVPGLYNRLVESIAQCRYQCLYNWLFDGVIIPPTYVELEVNENDEVAINEGVTVSEDDVIHIYSIEPPPPEPAIISLLVEANGTYTAPEGTDGFNPVVVNIPGALLSGTSIPSPDLGEDGNVYRRYFPIPSDKAFVEYLECSGTQYINTGIYATQDIDAIVTGDRRSGSSGAGCMLGVRTGAFTSMTKTIYFGSHTDNAGAISVIKTGTSNAGSFINLSGISTRRTKTIKDENGYYIYYSSIDESPTYSKLYRQTGEWRSDMPLCMFAFYSGTTFNIGNSTRVIRVTILDKNVPIADYLPCLDGNGVACMWDNISGEYVYNDGTGDFLYGESVTPSQLSDVYYTKVNGVWKVI